MINAKKCKASLIIPIYNEIDCIKKELEALFKQDWINEFEVIIVDDGSTDGTSAIIEEYYNGPCNFILVQNKINLGYGAALKEGIRASSTDYIIITDCDNSYPNDRIPEFVNLAIEENYDMVVGARIGQNVATPLIRKPMKWILGKLASQLAGTRIPDINSGLRVFRKDICLASIDYLCDGFSFTTTITLIMLTNGFNVKYIPIDYFPRGGHSKIHPIKDTLNFILLITMTVFYFKPLRVILPICTPLIAGSIILFFIQAVFYKNITTSALILFQSSLNLFFIAVIAELIIKSNNRQGGITKLASLKTQENITVKNNCTMK